MQPRGNTGVDMLIARAQEKLRELKELQFFGGDALNLKRWSHTFDLPPDGTEHCWRLVITPQDPTKCMPFEAYFRPASATSYMTGQVEAVHRSDGNFEYLLIAQANFDSVSRPTKVSIEYTGVAAFTLTQLG